MEFDFSSYIVDKRSDATWWPQSATDSLTGNKWHCVRRHVCQQQYNTYNEAVDGVVGDWPPWTCGS